MQSSRALTDNLLYIFLDIDGVLLNFDYRPFGNVINQLFEEKYQRKADKQKDYTELYHLSSQMKDHKAFNNLLAFISIAEKNGFSVRIVISSNWRLDLTLNQFGMLFPSLKPYFYAKTPNKVVPLTLNQFLLDLTVLPRGFEILSWQKSESGFMNANFIILDDNTDCLDILFGENFIYCKNLFNSKKLSEAEKHLLSGKLRFSKNNPLNKYEQKLITIKTSHESEPLDIVLNLSPDDFYQLKRYLKKYHEQLYFPKLKFIQKIFSEWSINFFGSAPESKKIGKTVFQYLIDENFKKTILKS